MKYCVMNITGMKITPCPVLRTEFAVSSFMGMTSKDLVDGCCDHVTELFLWWP